MKVAIVFACLVASISGLPYSDWIMPSDLKNERFVTGAIESAIQDVSQAIKDAGLDPFRYEGASSSYELPVPVIFNYEAIIEDIFSYGLSNIKINRLNYSVLLSRLTFDLELPLIHFSLGAAKANGVVFSNRLSYDASGKIDVVRVRVSGQVRVSIGIISGISIRSLTIDFSLGDINSDVNLAIMGKDYSDDFNSFLGTFVPYTIKAHSREINELLEIILLELINANM